MKQAVKKLVLLMLPVLAALALSGCSMPQLTLDPQELYALPTLPAKYTELNTKLRAILEEGAEYAAPTAGTNIQPVQLVDLDGDGAEEALAFFRNSNEEKNLKIYVFTSTEDSYRQMDLIEGSGSAIYSIEYEDLNSDGRKELEIAWTAMGELQVLEIYRLRPGGAEPLVRTNYVKYATADLNQDKKREVIVIRADEEGEGIAECYDWNENGVLSNQSAARISVSMAELSQQGRVTEGMLREEVPALFVTGVTNTSRAVTDILAIQNEEMTNIVLSGVTGLSGQVAPYASLYPTDIDSDGMTEVPWPIDLLSMNDDGSSYRRVDWYSYDRSGKAEVAMRSYHNLEDGWYFRLPEEWLNRIWISRATLPDEAIVTFYILGGSGEATPFLRLSALTGTNREVRAVRDDRVILSRQQETIYTARLLEANETWEYGMTADEVREAFVLITPEWGSEQ